jgi:hypothetical protein
MIVFGQQLPQQTEETSRIEVFSHCVSLQAFDKELNEWAAR